MFDKIDLSLIEDKASEWEDSLYRPFLRRYGERREIFQTNSGITIKPLYTPKDIEGINYLRDIGFPADYPFTRGIHPGGFRSRTWLTVGVTGFGTAEETNQRLRYLLGLGETGLNIEFDNVTNYHGIDADNPAAEGEVGKNGVSINTLADMEDLFDGISIEEVNIVFAGAGGTPAVALVAMFVAMAEKRGIHLSRLRGTFNNSGLQRFDACYSPISSPRHVLNDWCDIVEFVIRNMPNFNPAAIAGYHYREAGVNAVQEVALALSAGITYTEALLKRGLTIDEFAHKYTFFFSLHNDFFEEIAKFRVARRMWAKIVKERFGARDQRAMRFRVHTQTSGATLRAEQPLNNIARAAIQSLAAVLGGTNSLYTDPYDEALCLPSEESHRLAMRTQQIILEETGVADTIDPLAGSYYVEWLTNRLEEEAWKYIKEIDDLGGGVAAIESGWTRKIINKSFYEYQDAVRKGEQIIVGYNKYRTEEEIPFGTFSVDPIYEEKQKKRLKIIKQRRDSEETRRALEEVYQAAKEGNNLVPSCVKAAKTYATLEEMIMAITQARGGSYIQEFKSRIKTF